MQQAKELINDYLRTPSCAKKRVVVIQGASHRTVGIVSQSLTEAENVELDRKLSEVASATGSLKIHVFGLSKEGASISVSLRSGEVMCNGEKVLHRQASGIGRFSAEQLDRMVIFTEAWGKAVIPDTDPQKQRMIEDITGCFSERV
ncbi:MAG: hypothetical protein JSS61_06865 [Verrucomicrobia bacterium]|nr:hypothetical protein [Verrucomicrobiota bacterium]